jgi:hypothetical protein
MRVQRLKQELRGPVAKCPLELVHHQTVAVAAQPFEGQRGTRDVAT